MYTFSFSCEFSGYTFNTEEFCKELFSKDGVIFYLQSIIENVPIKDSKKFKIKGVGFLTEEKAFLSGVHAINVIFWYGLNKRIGVKLIEIKGGFSDISRKKIQEENGITILNTKNLYKNCLIVYNEENPSIISNFSGNLCVLKPIEDLSEYFQQSKNLKFTDDLKLEMELYHASHLEISLRAKFLTQMIIIESLITKNKRSDAAVKHIKYLKKITKESDLNENDMDDLIQNIGNLKYNSITSSGRSLVSNHLNSRQYNRKSAEDFFKECYSIRSELVHGDEIKNDDLSKITNEFDRMVSDLLIALVEEQKS